MYSTNKVFLGNGSKRVGYNTVEVLQALKDFGDDAISKNSQAASIDNNAIENIKNNFASKRLLTNIANIAITLGGLSVLPKLYAPSDVAPGAKVMAQANQQKTDNAKDNNTEKTENAPTFKGKGINSDGFFPNL